MFEDINTCGLPCPEDEVVSCVAVKYNIPYLLDTTPCGSTHFYVRRMYVAVAHDTTFPEYTATRWLLWHFFVLFFLHCFSLL